MDKTYVDMIHEEFEKLKDFNEEIDEDLLYYPKFLDLLCDMLDSDVVDRESRILINASLGYSLTPNDLVPEDVYGPYGYMDDMYISAIVLKKLRINYPDLVDRLWNNDEKFDEVLDRCIFKSEKFLNEKNLKEKILVYCGLED